MEARSPLSQALAVAPCTTYTEVLARLSAIEAALSPSDGLIWFNRLYAAMTQAVADRAARGGFKDPQFLQILDCTFAELYFAAVRAYLSSPRTEPSAWTPLLAARRDSRIQPLQFALAGVNAHINRDLPVALVRTFERIGGGPERGDARHDDYLLVNTVIGDVYGDAKKFLFSDTLAHIDTVLGSVDDVLELWSMARARDAAWVAGEVQWQLRRAPFVAAQHLATLDQLVGLTSRGLLRCGT